MEWDFSDDFQINATLVANRFIDEYMAGASGEYVKIYLYLLRHRDRIPDAAQTAEALHCTEGDVRRAIAYWQKTGVMTSRAGESQTGETAKALPPESRERIRQPAETGKKDAAGPEAKTNRSDKMPAFAENTAPAGKRSSQDYSLDNISRLSADEDFSQLLYIAQKYMNKVFTQRECQVFGYLYDELKLSAELLEYLVEYCVQNGHTSIRYMETVALNWHQKGLLTLEAAKDYSAGFQKDYFAVMKAFGLTDRRPAEAEKRFMENWFGAWGFTREVVVEACNRTIAATHSPSFPYADKILAQWKKAGVKNLSDVEELDMIRRSQEREKDGSGKGTKSSDQRNTANRFHNFQQSATDYDSLMMEKVRARMKE